MKKAVKLKLGDAMLRYKECTKHMSCSTCPYWDGNIDQLGVCRIKPAGAIAIEPHRYWSYKEYMEAFNTQLIKNKLDQI